MITMLEDTEFMMVMECETAKEMWDTLSATHCLSGDTGIADLTLRWMNVSMAEGTDLKDYLAKNQNLKIDATRLGANIPEATMCTYLLSGLPPSYANTKKLLRMTGKASIYNILVQELLADDNEVKLDRSLFIAKSAKVKTESKTVEQALSAVPPKKKLADHSKLTCFGCQEIGHITPNCPNKSKTRHAKKAARSAKTEVAKAVVSITPTSKPTFSMVAVSSSKESTFYLDSGCSTHTCGDRGLMFDIVPHTGSITSANGENVRVEFMGSVRFKNKDGMVFEVKGVQFVEGFSNLLSFSQINSKAVVSWNRGHNSFSIHTPTKIKLADCDLHENGLYELKATSILNPNSTIAMSAASEGKALEVLKWHRRMGHISWEYMKRLAAQGVLKDVTTKDIDLFKIECVTCTKGKMVKSSFPASESHAKAPLDLIHSDVMEMPIKSPSGMKYVVTFLDDFSRYLWSFPIKLKSDVFATFLKWKTQIELELKTPIRCFRSDNGGEFISHEWADLFEKSGIRRETTVAHNPQQNGRSEIRNKILENKMDCMLIDCGLSRGWWAEALTHATYLINRSPSKPLKMKSPFEVLRGELPDLSTLHIFGSPCEILVLPAVKKLQPKSKTCLFLGYSGEKKAFRLVEKGTRNIHVRFFEGPDLQKSLAEIGYIDFDDDVPAAEDYDSLATDVAVAADTEPLIDLPMQRGREGPIIDGMRTTGSGRPTQLPARFRESVGSYALAYKIVGLKRFEIPKSYQEAIAGPDALKWKEATLKELQALGFMEVWAEIAVIPEGKRALGTVWIFDVKENPDGSPKFKARLAALGNHQIEGVDYVLTYSPAARMNTTRAFLSIANHHNLWMLQGDFITAYLNAPIEEELYLRPPLGYSCAPGTVLRVQKALYGFKQSGRAWHLTLDDETRKFGMVPLDCEPCIYRGFINSVETWLIVYVDDIGIASRTEKGGRDLMNLFKSRFRVDERGDFTHARWLGIEIKRDRIAGTFTFSQDSYIDNFLDKFNISGYTPKSPLPVDVQSHYPPPTEEEKEAMVNIPYLSAVGTLIWLSMCTRPDIAFAVNFCARFNSCPGPAQWKLVLHIMRFVMGTRHYDMVFKRYPRSVLLACFSDSDHAGDPNSRKSVSGVICFAYGNPVLWMSKRQNNITLSSYEAEYVASALAARQLRWLQYLLSSSFLFP